MTKASALEPISENAIIVALAAQPVRVLQDPQQFDLLTGAIRQEIAAQVPDLTTAKGREAIASLAFKIARTKTAIDDAGKALNEDARKQIGVVDEARRKVRDTFDKLRDEARAPLNEWEAQEAAREERVKGVIGRLRAAAVVSIDDTSDRVINRLAGVQAIELPEEEFRGQLEIAQSAKDQAVSVLTNAADRLEKEEADKAELDRLRREKAERDEADAAAEALRRQDEQRAANTGLMQAPAKPEQGQREELPPMAAPPPPTPPTSGTDPRLTAALRGAREGLMSTVAIQEAVASAIIRAIVAGEIPHVAFNL